MPSSQMKSKKNCWLIGVFLLAGCTVQGESGLPEIFLVGLSWFRQIFVLAGVGTGFGSAWMQQNGTRAPSPLPSVFSPRKGVLEIQLSLASPKPVAQSELNKEILEEMVVVVLQKEPQEWSSLSSFLEALDQGASYEEVYRGMIRSPEYQRLEQESGGASVEALKVFSALLSELEKQLPAPTPMDTLLQAAQVSKETSQSTEVKDLSSAFVGVPLFTLKKIIGEEALKVIAAQSEYREKLALWYSKWAIQMAKRSVDFGFEVRNNQNEAFYYRWALAQSRDLLQWEILNRFHRLLNQANRSSAE